MNSLTQDNLIQIDGCMGEGGGQVLRTALSLSMLTGKGFRIDNIRGKRKKPGLMRQHLTCVKAAQELCNAEALGASVGSSRLDFMPGPVMPGKHRFSVGTAGSTILVLQSVLPAMMVAHAPTEITIEGGTHNFMAPPFEYLSEVLLPVLERMGPKVELELERYGFYPAGGGCIHARIEPVEKLTPLTLTETGGLMGRELLAMSSKIPGHVGHREIRKAKQLLKLNDLHSEVLDCDSVGPGNILMMLCHHEQVTEMFSVVGSIDQSSEKVAKGVVNQFHKWMKANVPVGDYLADQLMLPCAMAATKQWGARPEQASVFRSTPLTLHSQTQMTLIPRFLPVTFEVTDQEEDKYYGRSNTVKIQGQAQ